MEKKIDIKGIIIDAVKYLISAFFIAVIFCVCMQNGWISNGKTLRVGYREFWCVVRSITFLVPGIIFVKSFRGHYTCYIKTISSKPLSKAKIQIKGRE